MSMLGDFRLLEPSMIEALAAKPEHVLEFQLRASPKQTPGGAKGSGPRRLA